LSRPPHASSSDRIAKIGHDGAGVSTSTANSRHGIATAPMSRTASARLKSPFARSFGQPTMM